MALQTSFTENVINEAIPLNKLRRGQKGIILAIDGGRNFASKIESMGLHIGVTIEIVSAQLLHGPVTIRVGSTQAALGYGMAGKIMVRPE
jgi:Fe2+ transport system protein FeoA